MKSGNGGCISKLIRNWLDRMRDKLQIQHDVESGKGDESSMDSDGFNQEMRDQFKIEGRDAG